MQRKENKNIQDEKDKRKKYKKLILLFLLMLTVCTIIFTKVWKNEDAGDDYTEGYLYAVEIKIMFLEILDEFSKMDENVKKAAEDFFEKYHEITKEIIGNYEIQNGLFKSLNDSIEIFESYARSEIVYNIDESAIDMNGFKDGMIVNSIDIQMLVKYSSKEISKNEYDNYKKKRENLTKDFSKEHVKEFIEAYYGYSY